jgi:hypothetical protein
MYLQILSFFLFQEKYNLIFNVLFLILIQKSLVL